MVQLDKALQFQTTIELIVFILLTLITKVFPCF